jgi:hypothetical protein
MSALSPLSGAKRKLDFGTIRSAFDHPSRTSATVNCRSSKDLFDHLVGSGEQLRREMQTQGVSGLEIDHQFEFR